MLAIPFGLRVHLGDLLLAFLLLGLIGLMLSAASNAIALKLRSEDALAPLMNRVAQPLLLLSGILLPLAFAPVWLQRVADWNPFSWAVDGSRALFAGDPGNDSVWQALLILAVLTAPVARLGRPLVRPQRPLTRASPPECHSTSVRGTFASVSGPRSDCLGASGRRRV